MKNKSKETAFMVEGDIIATGNHTDSLGNILWTDTLIDCDCVVYTDTDGCLVIIPKKDVDKD